jgi:hypothetical protein
MLLRLVPPVAALLLPLAAWAGPCDLTDDQSSCSRVLACFGDQGRWFEGRAFGRGMGTLSGTVNDGVGCAGIWTSENADGVGEAQVRCEDGLKVTVLFTYQDSYTGTTTGEGVASTGVAVKTWSGLHVPEFLRSQSKTGEAALPCGAVEIPIS